MKTIQLQQERIQSQRYGRVWWSLILDRPAWVLLISLTLVVLLGSGIRFVSKDPSVDAFVPSDHPAARARDQAKTVFGLEDPVVIGLSAYKGQTVFRPETLTALRTLHQQVRLLDGVKKNDVISLASENAIGANNGDLTVKAIVPAGDISSDDAQQAALLFRDMPMLSGLLASQEEDFLTLIVPVENPDNANGTIEAIKHLADQLAAPYFKSVHVAGVATMNARLAQMVDADTRVFVPAAVLTVLLILVLALRSIKAVIGPLLVIAGSAAVAIGVMGWMGAHYYLITSALPVVIMAIAVADSLHITAFYLRARSANAQLTAKDAAIIALKKAALPVTLTTLTTVVAFAGLSVGAAMQPISEFGYFAACGVAAAWLLSLSVLPVILVITDLKPKKQRVGARSSSLAAIELFVLQISSWSFSKPFYAIAVTLLLLLALLISSFGASFDYQRQHYFTVNDPVRQADNRISEGLGGVNFLDVVVTAPQSATLMKPEALVAMRDLRLYMTELPGVVKVSGIDQYISLIHSVLMGATYGDLPSKEKAPAQYMFLYEASAAPEDFKQEIDFEHRRALLRAQLSTDQYLATRPVVETLRQYLRQWSQETGLDAVVSGRVAVNEGWMTRLSDNHFKGVGMALVMVFIVTLLAFRKLGAAVLAMLPIVVGVLAVYSTMGAFDIAIAPATSMTTAIATGLGVDFGVHLISHLRRVSSRGEPLTTAFNSSYATIGRACFYSAVALGVALIVICISSAPPLRWFGLLVSIGAFGSLLGALLMIPALSATFFSVSEERNK